MAAAKAAKSRVPRRHWPLAEKRRIVELTLPVGASIVEIAGRYALHPTMLYQWRRLYHAGELDAQLTQVSEGDGSATNTMFVPVRVVPGVKTQLAMQRDTSTCCSSVMHVMLGSGSALRLETTVIDIALVCAVVAELRR